MHYYSSCVVVVQHFLTVSRWTICQSVQTDRFPSCAIMFGMGDGKFVKKNHNSVMFIALTKIICMILPTTERQHWKMSLSLSGCPKIFPRPLFSHIHHPAVVWNPNSVLLKFSVLVSAADGRRKDTDSSPLVMLIDSYITVRLSEVFALERFLSVPVRKCFKKETSIHTLRPLLSILTMQPQRSYQWLYWNVERDLPSHVILECLWHSLIVIYSNTFTNTNKCTVKQLSLHPQLCIESLCCKSCLILNLFFYTVSETKCSSVQNAYNAKKKIYIYST